jgi:diphthamide biosynthesis protein 4
MNHYEILSLPSPPHHQSLSAEVIKRAYHAALLSHHPDKKSPPGSSSKETSSVTSVDAIKLAYDVLSHTSTRLEYDRKLRLDQNAHRTEQAQDRVLGNEIVDLDDMILQEDGISWRRACRCGDSAGYVITEWELEDIMDKGEREVVVLCRGCSLGVRILFGVVDESG